MTRVILLLIILSSRSGPYMGKDLFGADEFVLDSYKIREGKISILEMEGCPCEELDVELMYLSRDDHGGRLCTSLL